MLDSFEVFETMKFNQLSISKSLGFLQKKPSFRFFNLETESCFWIVLAVTVNTLLIAYTVKYTLQYFPMSPDEYAYQISAQLFADGKLSTPSPEYPWFFSTLNCVNDGAYYGKYPPGWPAILSLGKTFHAEWWINPLLSALTLIAVFSLMRAFFSAKIANITLILTIACPFLIFNSSCLLSHASGLLLLSISAHYLLLLEKDAAAFIGLGITSGFAFMTRPFTALLFLAPLVLFMLINAIRFKKTLLLRGLFLRTLPIASVFIGLFLLYSFAQTGDALLQPFEKYASNDRLGFFSHTWSEYTARINQNIVDRAYELLKWTSGIPLVFLFLPLLKLKHPVERLGLILAIPFFSLFVGYFFYVGSGIFQYGPRYLYESYTLMLIPISLLLLKTKRALPLILTIVVFFNALFFAKYSLDYRARISHHKTFFEKARTLRNSLIFVRSNDYGSSLYFTRNNLDFNSSTLFVLDSGDDINKLLLSKYPDRTYYSFDLKDFYTQEPFKPYEVKR
jgi:hypothetical protein